MIFLDQSDVRCALTWYPLEWHPQITQSSSPSCCTSTPAPSTLVMNVDRRDSLTRRHAQTHRSTDLRPSTILWHRRKPDLPVLSRPVHSNPRRSETLQPIHYPYIQALELTTILVLSPEKPSRALKSFAEENDIKLV